MNAKRPGERTITAGSQPVSAFRPPSFPVCRPLSVISSPSSVVRHLSSVICRPAFAQRATAGRLSSVISSPPSVVRRLPSGFSLVELMVVVAIISVLLMLLIPNIRTMREKAWSSSCQNNLRQYGIAMNQYMADWNGDFVYAGAGGAGGKGYIGSGPNDVQILDARNPDELSTRRTTLVNYGDGKRIAGYGGISGSAGHDWQAMVRQFPGRVSIKSLAAGQTSIRVCPVIMHEIKTEGNFFDPKSPNFKGLRDEDDLTVTNPDSAPKIPTPDFMTVSYTNITSDTSDTNSVDDLTGAPDYNVDDLDVDDLVLDSAFTTYAINFWWIHHNKKDIPANVVAFIDWNARDGWGATLNHTNAAGNPIWMFNGTNSAGVAVAQTDPPTPKRADGAWWLTEVGFHHLQGNVYGANYVAMDGHCGWVGSNTISITNFTTGQ